MDDSPPIQSRTKDGNAAERLIVRQAHDANIKALAALSHHRSQWGCPNINIGLLPVDDRGSSRAQSRHVRREQRTDERDEDLIFNEGRPCTGIIKMMVRRALITTSSLFDLYFILNKTYRLFTFNLFGISLLFSFF